MVAQRTHEQGALRLAEGFWKRVHEDLKAGDLPTYAWLDTDEGTGSFAYWVGLAALPPKVTAQTVRERLVADYWAGPRGWVSLSEAMDILGVDEAAIRRLVASRQLPSRVVETTAREKRDGEWVTVKRKTWKYDAVSLYHMYTTRQPR